jgi:methyltransferase (TIGR00027 family)
MRDEPSAGPDSTAVRAALWRAMHVQVDPPPHVLEDEIGLKLAAPDEGWRNRPNMNPQWTRRIRAAIAARARFVEDLMAEQADRGVGQYVILGAGLDTFAQRRFEIASGPRVFEVDRSGPQEWKRQRLIDLGYGGASGCARPAFLGSPARPGLCCSLFSPERSALSNCRGTDDGAGASNLIRKPR